MNSIAPLFPSSSSYLRIMYPQQCFKCRDLLSLQPGMLWRLESGVVRSLSWNQDGRLFTLGFWGQNDVVGQPLSRMMPYQVECLTAVTMSQLPPEDGYLQKALLAYAWKSEALLSIIHQSFVADRLLGLLEWLSVEFGQITTCGTLLNLYLTHRGLAETINTTRVTITRLLNQLEQEGKILRTINNFSKELLPQGQPLYRQSLILRA